MTQNRGDLLLNLVANKSILGRCHLLHRVEDLWKEKPLFGWSGLAWTAYATTLGRPGMCRALESLVSWYTRSRFSIVGHKVGPTSFLLPLCMTLLWCCQLLQVLLVYIQLASRRGPGCSCKVLILSERPTLLLMRL